MKKSAKPPAKPPIKVDPEINLKEIEDAIRSISNIGKLFDASRLKKRVVVMLIKDITGVSMSDIEKVLSALPRLEKEFLK